MNKKRFQPEDMKYIHYLSGVTISPDGKKAAYVDSVGDEESGLFPSQIYLADLDTGEIRQLSVAGGSAFCRQPRFLSAERLACLAGEDGEEQIYVLDLDGDHGTKLTTARHGVNRFTPSKDGRTIVFETELWAEEIEENIAFCQMSAEERASWQEELEYKPIEVTDLTYKMDEWHGMRQGQLPRIAKVDLVTGEQQLLVKEELESVYPSVSGDGSRIAFYGYPHTGAKGRQPELFVCDADGENRRQLTVDAGVYADHSPAFSADGTEVIFMAFPEYTDGSCIMLPYAVSLESGSIRCLMKDDDDKICHGFHPMVSNRTEYGINPPYFQVSEDGKQLYFLSSFQGRENLYAIALDGKGQAQRLLAGDTDIHAFDMAEEGTIAYLMGTVDRPAELYYKRPEQAGKRLTDVNPWLDQYIQPEVEEFWIKSGDGRADLQVWLMHPAGQEDDRLYPAVLYIRGGPECTYNADFWHEFQALAGAGMAVIYTNPRGSTGYGREFCAEGIAWKDEAMDDLVRAVSACVDKGFIDAERIGVTGGSYGGYMTNKFIGRTSHFAAAVTQRSLINPATSYGTGDMGFISSNPQAKDVKMLDYLMDRARGNALTYIDNMKVPLLILHGYRDYRCSFEQSEQLFIAMKDRNPQVPVRMVMFPEENHGVDRVGRLYNQIRHLQEMTDWFSKYLTKGGEGDA